MRKAPAERLIGQKEISVIEEREQRDKEAVLPVLARERGAGGRRVGGRLAETVDAPAPRSGLQTQGRRSGAMVDARAAQTIHQEPRSHLHIVTEFAVLIRLRIRAMTRLTWDRADLRQRTWLSRSGIKFLTIV